MKQSFNVYRCKISLLPLLIFICLLALLLRLGFWQLSRAEEKRDFLANQQEKMQRETLPIAKLLAGNQELRYRRVLLEGHYDVEHQFLLDNQFHNGKVGYFVLTPFILAADGQVVMVNRGWVVMNKDRNKLPDIDFKPVQGMQTIAGIINYFPQVGLILEGADEPGNGWPSVVQLINPLKIKQKLQQPILDFQVQLSTEQPSGYVREWKINTRMPPEKHVAYAFQWFALAVTLTFLAFWLSYKAYKND
ncbi:MAG: SURF1 family protein [Methyloprofundus sp.]|nr:SURF1 family protein [Methyloprofundus sp.]